MSDESKTAWVEEELESIDLGDERLGKRCQLLLTRFAADPQASVNGTCHGWSETVGAYRFFDHDAVDEHRVLQPHRDATLKRMKEHPVVLVVQDTTELDYTSRRNSLRGAGPLNDETRVGFYDHLQVAFTPHRLCLGVLAMEVWARDWETFRTCKERKYDPIETKESYRWLQGYRQACQIAEQLPETQIVSVADREADIYECFLEAQQPAPPKRAEWIIRASENRSLPEPDLQAGPSSYRKLRDAIADAPVLGRRSLKVPKTPKHKARRARVTIRAQKIRLKPPYRPGIVLPELEVHVILVREEKPPAGEEPIEWLLLTSLPIETLPQVLQVMDYYTCRWQIEVYQPEYTSSAGLYRLAA